MKLHFEMKALDNTS